MSCRRLLETLVLFDACRGENLEIWRNLEKLGSEHVTLQSKEKIERSLDKRDRWTYKITTRVQIVVVLPIDIKWSVV